MPGLVLAVIVGAASFCCLGFAISTRIGAADAAAPVTNLTVLPLYFISGVFVPEDQIPALLRAIADVFPIRHLAVAMLTPFVDHAGRGHRGGRPGDRRGLGGRRAGLRRARLPVVAADGLSIALEEDEGLYELVDGRLIWRGPEEENVHLEVSVRDASDGRFVPGAIVHATLVGADGEEHGEHELGLLWHPMIYHYGGNLRLPGSGRYGLRIRVEPPTFMRHDEVNGRRFAEAAEVEFDGVEVEVDKDAG